MANFNTIAEVQTSTSGDFYHLQQGGIDYKHTRETLAGAISNARWSSTLTYDVGSQIVGSDGKMYVCLVQGSGEDPTLDDGTNWLRFRRDGSDKVNHFSGFRTVRNSSTQVEFFPGSCSEINGSATMGTVSNIVKNIDSAWVQGDGGSLATGATLAANGNAYFFAVLLSDGSTDIILDDNKDGSNLSSTTTVVAQRGVLFMTLDSSAELTEYEDEGSGIIKLTTPTRILNANNPGTGAQSLSVMEDPEIVLVGEFGFVLLDAVNTVRAWLRSTTQSFDAPAASNMDLQTQASGGASRAAINKMVRIASDGLIRYRLDTSTADTSVFVFFHGWTDTRSW